MHDEGFAIMTATNSGLTSPPGSPGSPGVPARNFWILSSWRDLLLFVATPILIIPLLRAAQTRWSIEEIGLFVVAFGATGHHLPGFLRAYGDPELFARFKVRFIVAPIFMIGVCTLFVFYQMSGVMLVLYFWAIWHGLMQTYGFLRIYDAKVKSFAKITTRLDLAMCLTWFAAGTLLSSGRLASILNQYYSSGGAEIAATTIKTIQHVALFAVVVTTIAFAINHIRLMVLGHQPSPIKVLLMVTSFGFWIYSTIVVSNLIVGAALFEIFHDVQYLSIVWIVNRKRAESGKHTSSFLTFLFRRSGVLVGLYVGLVFAYGSSSLITETVIEGETLKNIMTGLLIASAGLHFYYDGFIWKVREKATRKTLDLDGGEELSGNVSFVPPWLIHGSKWALFVIPVLLLGIAELRGAMSPSQRVSAVAKAIPDSAAANLNRGVQMIQQGNLFEAISFYEKAIALQPKLALAYHNMGLAMVRQQRYDDAADYMEKALKLGPITAYMQHDMGSAYFSLGRIDDAIEHYRLALEIDPNRANSHFFLGAMLMDKGQRSLAVSHWQQALKIDPNYQRAAEELSKITLQNKSLNPQINTEPH